MKSKNWLMFSVGLNLFLSIMMFSLWTDRATVEVDSTITSETPVGSTVSNLLFAKEAVPLKKKARLKDWIHNLRDSGVPDKWIACVAAADFESRWQKKMSNLRSEFTRGEISNDEFKQFIAQHDAGQETELRATLDENCFRQWDREKVLRGFDLDRLQLSEAETAALYHLQKLSDQHRQELTLSRLKAEVDEATLEKKTESLQDEYEKQLHTLLGDARYSSLHTSDSAIGDLLRNLSKLHASAEQTGEMQEAQQRWQEACVKTEALLSDGKLTGQEYEQQLKTEDASRDRQFQQTLGANGFAEFQKNQDGRYQTMQRYATAWNLTDDDINFVYASIRRSDTYVRDYRQWASNVEAQGQPVDWEALQKSLKDYSKQTDQALETYLGDELFIKLRQGNALTRAE